MKEAWNLLPLHCSYNFFRLLKIIFLWILYLYVIGYSQFKDIYVIQYYSVNECEKHLV